MGSSTQPSVHDRPLPHGTVFQRGAVGPQGAPRPGIDLAELVAGYRRAAPPLGVRIAFVVVVAVLIIGPLASLLAVGLGQSVLGGVAVPGNVPLSVTLYGLMGLIVSSLVGVAVALEMRAGRQWARLVCMAIALVALGFSVVGLVQQYASVEPGAPPVDFLLIVTALQVVLLALTPVFLLVPGSREYFR